MTKTKEVKILYNLLNQKLWRNDKDEPIIEKPFYQISEIIEFTIKLKKIDRFYNLKDNKFCFIESSTTEKVNKNVIVIYGFFKSARNEFRPNLIDKRNGNERKNPKTLSEGDIEKTHFSIRLDKNQNEVYFFLENNFYGVNMNNVVNYFSHYCKKYLESVNLKKNFTIFNSCIMRNDFLQELEKFSRTRIAEIYFDKQLLGSKALNFSDRTVSLRKELKLVAAASPRESITEVAIDFFNKLNGKNSVVSKVRVYGNDDEDNEVIIDTSFFNKIEFVSTDVNPETGELNSEQLFTSLKKIANSI